MFRINQNSLGVLQEIVKKQPDIKRLFLFKHKAQLNWSEKYTDVLSRKKNLLQSLQVSSKFDKIPYNRKEFLSLSLQNLVELGDPRNNIVVSIMSKVLTNHGQFKHLLLMNFHPEMEYGADEAIKVIQHTMPSTCGCIVNSGRYFHYYGTGLLTQRQWEDFMGIFLIPFHLVHPGYIGYSLRQGFAPLRLTTGNDLKKTSPKVIQIIRTSES